MVERTHIGRVILLCTLVFSASLYSEEKHEEKKTSDRGELATEFGSELTDEEILSEASDGVTSSPTGSKGVVDSNLAELGDELKSDPSLTGSDEALFNPPEYRVLEREGEIELKTPYGDYLVRGKFGPKGLAHYKFAVPLDAIKPPEKVEDEDEDLKEDKPEEKEPPRQMASVGPVGNTDIMIVEANRLFNRKRYYEALTVVESILRQDPNYVRGWIMKGSLLHVQGHKELAKKAWNHALTLKPGDPEILGILQRYR